MSPSLNTLNKLYLNSILSILAALLAANLSFAQNNLIDSLFHVLKTEKNDTNKVKTLNTLSDKLEDIGKYDSSINCANIECELAERLGYKRGMAMSYSLMGIIYGDIGNRAKAVSSLLKAIEYADQINDKKTTAANLSNLGIIYRDQGDYPKALENFYKAIAIDKQIGNKVGIAINLCNMGVLYRREGNYLQALEQYNKALPVFEDIGYLGGISAVDNDIGAINQKQGNYSVALNYYVKGLTINQKIGDKGNIACSLGNIGITYFQLHNEQKALEYQYKSLTIYEQIGNMRGIANNMDNIGASYMEQKNMSMAKTFLDSALNISVEIGAKDLIKDIYLGLYSIDSSKGNLAVAMEDYKKYIKYKDSLQNEESVLKIAQMEENYAFEAKEDSIKAEETKMNIVSADKIKRKDIIAKSAVAILLLILVLSVLLFRLQRIRREKAKLIFEQEKSMLESQKKQIEDELANAKIMLDEYIRGMLEKNELMEQLKNDFEELKNLKSKELNEVRLEDIEHLNKASILTEEDWDKFRKLFEQVHKGFFTRLKEKLPGLTQAEIRLVCLTKLNMDTKQMAGILGISDSTIRQTRYRLRKKFGLPGEGGLDDIIGSI